MAREHEYRATVRWTGNTGEGTASYRGYSRDHDILLEGKETPVRGSADAAFRGDAARMNPEEMLIAGLSACHMLWYLHLCADAGVVVTAYEDAAEGIMIEQGRGGGRFTGATLRPRVEIAAGSDAARAMALHDEAHRLCFIANSVNFEVAVEPAPVTVAD